MALIPNKAKQKVSTGRLALGMILRQSRTADIASIARACDFDWISIDLEHSAIGVEAAAQIASACLEAGVTALVRIPQPVYPNGTRLLDAGAQGLIVPHVDSAEDARLAVQACKYPPLGKRSIASVQPQLAFREVPADEVMEQVNDAMLLVVMLETKDAIENASSIAAVPGVDVLLIGANDLLADYGIAGKASHPLMLEALETVARAAREAGLAAGVSGLHEPAMLRKALELGFRFIGAGTDLSFLIKAGREKSQALRQLLP